MTHSCIVFAIITSGGSLVFGEHRRVVPSETSGEDSYDIARLVHDSTLRRGVMGWIPVSDSRFGVRTMMLSTDEYKWVIEAFQRKYIRVCSITCVEFNEYVWPVVL